MKFVADSSMTRETGSGISNARMVEKENGLAPLVGSLYAKGNAMFVKLLCYVCRCLMERIQSIYSYGHVYYKR